MIYTHTTHTHLTLALPAHPACAGTEDRHPGLPPSTRAVGPPAGAPGGVQGVILAGGDGGD